MNDLIGFLKSIAVAVGALNILWGD